MILVALSIALLAILIDLILDQRLVTVESWERLLLRLGIALISVLHDLLNILGLWLFIIVQVYLVEIVNTLEELSMHAFIVTILTRLVSYLWKDARSVRPVFFLVRPSVDLLIVNSLDALLVKLLLVLVLVPVSPINQSVDLFDETAQVVLLLAQRLVNPIEALHELVKVLVLLLRRGLLLVRVKLNDLVLPHGHVLELLLLL